MLRFVLTLILSIVCSSSAQSAQALRIAALQNKQLLDSAAAALAQFNDGPGKDTLQLRQHIFEKNWPSLDAAISYLSAKPFWKIRSPVLSLWRVRELFFSGAIPPLIEILDTLTVNPADPDAAWLLSVQLAAHNQDPAAFAVRGALESALFRHCFEEAVGIYTSLPSAERRAAPLAVLCPILRSEGRSDLILATVDACMDSCSAERYYYEGLALLENARPAEGRAFLEKLLSNHPQSVYAQTARIYLSARKTAPMHEEHQ